MHTRCSWKFTQLRNIAVKCSEPITEWLVIWSEQNCMLEAIHGRGTSGHDLVVNRGRKATHGAKRRKR
jgi:hypothetical protein